MQSATRYQFRTFLIMVFTIWLTVLLNTPAGAQYFGRNKLQYEDFQFKVLKTEHFDVHYYPKTDQAVTDAATMLERWYERYSQYFEHDLGQRQPVILYANHADFQQTNVISGLIPQGTRGVTEGLKNRMVIPLTGAYHESDHVLGHELVHAFQFSLIKANDGKLSRSMQTPLWIIEGLSEYLSVGQEDPLTAMWMRDAVLHDDVPTLEDVSYNQKYFPYRYGHIIWAYIAGRWGDQTVVDLFDAVLREGWPKAFESVMGFEADSLSKDWQQAIRDKYEPQLEGRTKPSEIDKALAVGEGGMNMAPVISPDGQYMVYLSRRDLFTLDLYLADAQTGEVLKKLVSSDTDSHFDALSFMNASGTWSPDSRQFAFVVFENGDNQVAILDVDTREIQQKFKPRQVDAIDHLAWSPDGSKIALAATFGGISNLYLYHLDADSTEALSDDRFAVLQPTWSPDGQTIVYITDRGEGTSLADLTFRPMQIALMDLQNNDVQFMAMGDHVKHINPQYTADGKNLYFVADPDGVSNIYRFNFDDRQFYQVTNVATGISGLTELSPAMSMSLKTGQLVFSVFEETEYNIYTLTATEATGEPFQTDATVYRETVTLLPFSSSTESLAEQYLSQIDIGEDSDTFDRKPYDASLQLIQAGQTTIGVSVDRFGSDLGGSTNLLFSDLLGNHMLMVAAQVNGGLKDIGAQVMYQNRDNRFNWGAAVGHIPYQTARYYSELDTVEVDGQNYLAENAQLIRERVFLDRVNLLAEYPLSTNRRFEFGTGYTRVSYDRTLEEALILSTGELLDYNERDIDNPEGLNLFQGNAAYVGDYSYFGFTSPVNGSRYRFEVEPTAGSLKYMSVLADYRHYLFLEPFTLAARAMHHGRYLADADDERLSNYNLGFQTWVRGYEVGSFELSECSEGGELNGCPEYDRLFGSRVGVMNLEARLPLFGTDELGLISGYFLPTDLVAFLDGGVAWTQDQSPEFELTTESGKRIPVFSAGAAARVNLFGYLVAQFYYAFPFQRPEQDGRFGFVLAPGW